MTAPSPPTTTLEWQPVSALPEGWRDENRELGRMVFLFGYDLYIGWPLSARFSRGRDDGTVWEASEGPVIPFGGVKWWAYCPLSALPDC